MTVSKRTAREKRILSCLSKEADWALAESEREHRRRHWAEAAYWKASADAYAAAHCLITELIDGH